LQPTKVKTSVLPIPTLAIQVLIRPMIRTPDVTS
jgi:hypothetical protein